jgi:hypothetical protein
MNATTASVVKVQLTPQQRQRLLEELGVRPDRVVTNLNGLLEFALSAPSVQ